MTANTRRSYRAAALIIPLVPLAAMLFAEACGDACANGTCTDTSSARLLDRACRAQLKGGPACETDKGAKQTTGLTADSTGFTIDTSGGVITLHLATFTAVQTTGTFDVEILARSTVSQGSPLTADLTWGSCGKSCPQNPTPFDVDLSDHYSWVKVVIAQPGSQSTLGSFVDLPYDAVLSLSSASIEIADLRTTEIFSPGACSLARPIGMRAR